MPKKSNPDIARMLEHYKSLEGDAAFKARTEHGMYPIIEICGYPFFVNTRAGRLQPKDNFLSPGIDLENSGYWNANEQFYLFCYDKKAQAEASIPPGITALPKHVVVIKVPTLYALDPVGCARLRGKDERSYLKRYPLKMYHQAEIWPLTPANLKMVTGIRIKEPANKQASAASKKKKSKKGGGKKL